jgi:hypothetical protein
MQEPAGRADVCVRWRMQGPERVIVVASVAEGVALLFGLSAAELDGFDDEQDHGDEEVAAQGEHRDFASG